MNPSGSLRWTGDSHSNAAKKHRSPGECPLNTARQIQKGIWPLNIARRIQKSARPLRLNVGLHDGSIKQARQRDDDARWIHKKPRPQIHLPMGVEPRRAAALCSLDASWVRRTLPSSASSVPISAATAVLLVFCCSRALDVQWRELQEVGHLGGRVVWDSGRCSGC